MSRNSKSLYRKLLYPLMFACAAAFCVGTSISFYIVESEYDELFDLSLRSKAQLMLPLMSAEFDRNGDASADYLSTIEGPELDEEEKAAFWLFNQRGGVLLHSDFMPLELEEATFSTAGFSDGENYRFFTTQKDANDRFLTLAEPLVERNEAIIQALGGAALSMGSLIAIAFAVMRWSIRRVQRSVVDLSEEIESKNEMNLTPIEGTTQFTEFAPAVRTLNALMARLEGAVEVERSFATNAAHELRTPLAVSLAQTQRLKAATEDPALQNRADEIEKAIKKLIHLVERLLQFSRAHSGLGKSEENTDASAVIDMLFAEAQQRASPDQIFCIHPPNKPYSSAIDPDALAILLSNLIDNALKYSTPGSMIELDAGTSGIVRISNDCVALTPQALAQIDQRFVRKTTVMAGFGIGLSIVKTLCEQSGATLTIQSPIAGKERGFSATVTLPQTG